MRPASTHLLFAAALGLAALVLAGCKGIPTGEIQADLQAETIDIDPVPFGGLTEVDVTVRFTNQGAPSNSLGFYVKLVVEDESGGIVFISNPKERFSGSLDEDELGTVTFTELVDAGGLATEYTFIATIDDEDEVDELDEDNNRVTTTLTRGGGTKVSN